MVLRVVSRYRSLAQVEEALEPYVAIAGQMTGKQLTIGRTLQLARHVGSPEDELKVVHVAGTSGKTSTCYYIADLLHRSGAKVGLTASPHIDSITERVQINGRPLADEVFCNYFDEFMKMVETVPDKPTYFELMMVFALWVFKKEKVDYAVIETGLGGLHDSSNITSRTDKLCVLTDIGLDHMHVLGCTIEEITAQKVGIVKPRNLLVMYKQSEAVMNIVCEYIAKQQGGLVVKTPDIDALFQQRNWQLAFAAYEQLRERDGLEGLSGEDIEQSQHLHVPGRMDIFTSAGKTIVLDGAHNEQKMSAFLASLTAEFPNTKFPVLMALKQGKELEQLAPLLAPYTLRLIATQLGGSQDTPIQSIESAVIADALRDNGVDDIEVKPNVKKAFDELLESDSEVVVVAGSLYLVAEVRRLLQATSDQE